MGYSISWLAVRGGDAETICHQLGLQQTGQYEAQPDGSFPLLGCQLPGDWYLVFSEDYEFAGQQNLTELSLLGELVTCQVEEHVMASAAGGWSDGKNVWSIDHNASDGIEHLQSIGQLPAMFAEIRDRLLTQQAHDDGGTDYVFDIPVEVALELTGFRHDWEIPVLSEKPFEVLLAPKKKRGDKKRSPQVGESKKSWWQFWK